MDHLFRIPGSPLPGSEPPTRGLFIDRWGTLLQMPRQGYVRRFDETEFTEKAVDALFRAHQAGWLLYLIGNEEAVWSGKLSDQSWQKIEADLTAHLASYGVPIQRSYACIDHPEGEGKHRRDSVYLLPNTGALYHACQTDGVVLSQSWVVGDSTLELVSGWRAGCRLAGVRTGLGVQDGEYHVEPNVMGDNLADALADIAGSFVRTR